MARTNHKRIYVVCDLDKHEVVDIFNSRAKIKEDYKLSNVALERLYTRSQMFEHKGKKLGIADMDYFADIDNPKNDIQVIFSAYYIRKLEEEVPKPVVKKEKKKSKTQLTLEYLKRHLEQYGNTVLMENPSKYKKKLMDKYGIDIEWTHIGAVSPDKNLVSDFTIAYSSDEHWIVKMKNYNGSSVNTYSDSTVMALVSGLANYIDQKGKKYGYC